MICRQQASRAGQWLQDVCYPNQNWSLFVVDVFPFIGWDFYRTWPWTTQRVCDFWLTLLKPMIKYQIAAITNYWEKCYEHLGTNGRTEVKQYTPPFQWSGGIIKLLWHMIIHGSVIRTKFQVCKLQLKHEINMTNLRVKLRLGSKSPSSESSPTSLPSSVISIERL